MSHATLFQSDAQCQVPDAPRFALVNHSVRDCYEEQDVFSAVGLPLLAPRERNRQRFWALWKAQGRA